MTVPVGSTCVVSEATPSAPTGGAWGTPQISPASFTVTAAGTTIAVTVTNTLRSELPATGGSVPWWAIALGGGLVLVGAVSLIVASRRRKTGA